ncbi:unnamed protein product, partial [Linum tenue]
MGLSRPAEVCGDKSADITGEAAGGKAQADITHDIQSLLSRYQTETPPLCVFKSLRGIWPNVKKILAFYSGRMQEE